MIFISPDLIWSHYRVEISKITYNNAAKPPYFLIWTKQRVMVVKNGYCITRTIQSTLKVGTKAQ